MTPLQAARLIQQDYYGFDGDPVAPDWTTWGVEASLVNHGHESALIFRGTDELSDWFSNIWSLPTHIDGLGWVHRGFWEGVERIWPLIWGSVAAVAGKGLTIIGHSKGGAEAALVAGLCVKNHIPVKGVITFGAPRCGRLSVLKDVPFQRYAHGGDPVPRVPPWFPHPCKPTNLNRTLWPDIPDHFIKNYITELQR